MNLKTRIFLTQSNNFNPNFDDEGCDARVFFYKN